MGDDNEGANEAVPDGTDEVWESMDNFDQRFLVNDIMFKGLVTLLVEKGVFTKDEITAHLLDAPAFRQMHQWRQDAMPAFERMLSFLWKD